MSALARKAVPPGSTGASADEGEFREERTYSVRAVERVCSILNLLQVSVDGVSQLDVATATGLPKSTALRYLWTLEAHRYVERDPANGLYRPGLGFVGMQSRQLEILRERSRPWLEKLRDELIETVNLGILDGESVIYLDVVESHREVRHAPRPGDRDPIHCTALGKAIAATLPESRVREILDHAGMPRHTDNTITTVDDYLSELVKVKRVGYAVDNSEYEVDGRCVAVSIPGTRLPAALSLSAPAARFPVQQVEAAARTLRDVAVQIIAANAALEPSADQ